MKKPNLFWILIDSARNYQTDEDTRGLPQSVVDFAKESVYFKNVVTSAPSTIQSISSMMTSSPSYLLSRSYNNYRGLMDCFDYFPHLAKDNGYDVFGAIYFKHGREIMSDVFGMIDNSYFPKDLKHRKEVWTNQDVFNLFTNIVEKHDWVKPTMTYLHYNVRVDVNVSEIVQQTLDKIKSAGLMDNSIILINSDHGYPAVSRGWDAVEAKKEGWGHDQQLYNDNILTPLVIKYPNCEPKQIEEFVATIDIVPTLCALMGIQVSEKFHGKNLIPLPENIDGRMVRTDNRYIGQLPSYSSFIVNGKKVIQYLDKNNN